MYPLAVIILVALGKLHHSSERCALRDPEQHQDKVEGPSIAIAVTLETEIERSAMSSSGLIHAPEKEHSGAQHSSEVDIDA